MNEDSHPTAPAGDAATTTLQPSLWIVIETDDHDLNKGPEAFLFDNEHYAWSWANGAATFNTNLWVIPLTGDYRKEIA